VHVERSGGTWRKSHLSFSDRLDLQWHRITPLTSKDLMRSSTCNTTYVPRHEKASYALGDLALSVYWNLFAIYLLFFYTDVFGISAAAAGTLFLVTRTWDAVSTPIVGVLADRTRSHRGKFRPYLLWASAPLCIAIAIGFYTPELPQGAKLAYAYGTYLLMVTLFTIVGIPYSALLGVITPNTHERNLISVWRFSCAFAGALFVQLSLLALVKTLGQGNLQFGFFAAVSCYGVLAFALLTLTFIFTRERVSSLSSSASVRACSH
jgi:GPH family glycoside/pentoside/hexuronide:cation symporter